MHEPKSLSLTLTFAISIGSLFPILQTCISTGVMLYTLNNKIVDPPKGVCTVLYFDREDTITKHIFSVLHTYIVCIDLHSPPIAVSDTSFSTKYVLP